MQYLSPVILETPKKIEGVFFYFLRVLVLSYLVYDLRGLNFCIYYAYSKPLLMLIGLCICSPFLNIKNIFTLKRDFYGYLILDSLVKREEVTDPPPNVPHLQYNIPHSNQSPQFSCSPFLPAHLKNMLSIDFIFVVC